MRLERLASDKIRVFLTLDDLQDRGISKEEMWDNEYKIQQLFRDMIDEADEELGFKADGPLSVEVYSLQSQGMIVIVKKEGSIENSDDEDDESFGDFIEMSVTIDESDDLFYEFQTFEDVIQVAHRLHHSGSFGGTLYLFEERYYLLFQHEGIHCYIDDFIAIVAEYAQSSTITKYRVAEYGKKIVNKCAIQQIVHYFKL